MYRLFCLDPYLCSSIQNNIIGKLYPVRIRVHRHVFVGRKEEKQIKLTGLSYETYASPINFIC
jgi:hypothetical protein